MIFLRPGWNKVVCKILPIKTKPMFLPNFSCTMILFRYSTFVISFFITFKLFQVLSGLELALSSTRAVTNEASYPECPQVCGAAKDARMQASGIDLCSDWRIGTTLQLFGLNRLNSVTAFQSEMKKIANSEENLKFVIIVRI